MAGGIEREYFPFASRLEGAVAALKERLTTESLERAAREIARVANMEVRRSQKVTDEEIRSFLGGEENWRIYRKLMRASSTKKGKNGKEGLRHEWFDGGFLDGYLRFREANGEEGGLVETMVTVLSYRSGVGEKPGRISKRTGKRFGRIACDLLDRVAMWGDGDQQPMLLNKRGADLIKGLF